MIVYSKRWFKLALTQSEFRMQKAHPRKGRINTVKGVQKKNTKLRKQVRPVENSMASSGEFEQKQFSARVLDDGIYNGDFIRKSDIKDIIKGFRAQIPLKLPYCFYTWTWCREIGPSREIRMRRLESKSQKRIDESLDIARLIRT